MRERGREIILCRRCPWEIQKQSGEAHRRYLVSCQKECGRILDGLISTLDGHMRQFVKDFWRLAGCDRLAGWLNRVVTGNKYQIACIYYVLQSAVYTALLESKDLAHPGPSRGSAISRGISRKWNLPSRSCLVLHCCMSCRHCVFNPVNDALQMG